MLGQSGKIFFYSTNEFKAVINFSVGYFHLQAEKVMGIWVNWQENCSEITLEITCLSCFLELGQK